MSEMKKKPIAEASNAELIAHARNVMGLEVKDGTGSVHIISKMRQADQNISEIIYFDAPAVEAAAPVVATAHKTAAAQAEPLPVEIAPVAGPDVPVIGTSYHHDPKVTIQIPKTEGPGGEQDVPVSVNGDQFIIQRDQEVQVPYRVWEALRAAMQTLYEQEKPQNLTDRPEVKSRNVLSYPFNTILMPPAAEIAAYKARVSAVFAP